MVHVGWLLKGLMWVCVNLRFLGLWCLLEVCLSDEMIELQVQDGNGAWEVVHWWNFMGH